MESIGNEINEYRSNSKLDITFTSGQNQYEMHQNGSGDAYLIADEGTKHTETYYTGGISYICTDVDGIKTYSTESGFSSTLQNNVFGDLQNIIAEAKFSSYEMTTYDKPIDWIQFYLTGAVITIHQYFMTIEANNSRIVLADGQNSDFFEKLEFDFTPFQE
jgi:hypothetical protein